MKAIYPFFDWCQNGPLNQIISSRESIFPALETFHLFGLTLLLGTIGAMLRNQPVSELAADLSPYTTWGLAISLGSGIPMFIGVAIKCYGATSFWIKMCFLATALIFHFTYFKKVVRSEEAAAVSGKLAAWGALVLWFGVGAAGRSIGFFD